MDTGRLVGQTIDQFYINQHIARGGMADVYLARDMTLERKVAFKVMLDALALDPQYVKRFQREARTVAQLDHPNIVQVYSTGQTSLGQPYIAGTMTVRITVQPRHSFQPIPIGEQVNGTIDLISAPNGDVTLGGIPFQLAPEIFKSQASTTPFTEAPTSLSLPTDIDQADQLHLLLNSNNGFHQFANQAIGRVEVVCNGTTVVVADLQAGVQLREWHNGPGVITTATQVQSVWSERISADVMGTIDLLTLDLPLVCQSGRLTSIELSDTSVSTVGSLDPALHLVGVSVEHYA